MCNCFQNKKLFFKGSKQSIRFRVPLLLPRGHSFPSEHLPILGWVGQASPQSWDRTRVQMAQSCQNAQSRTAYPSRPQALSVVWESSAAPLAAPRPHSNTCTPSPLPWLPVLHQHILSPSLFTSAHIHKPDQGLGLTSWARAGTMSLSHIQFITDVAATGASSLGPSPTHQKGRNQSRRS